MSIFSSYFLKLLETLGTRKAACGIGIIQRWHAVQVLAWVGTTSLPQGGRAGGGWHAQYLFCLFVLLWVALILFDSLSQQSQESLEPVSGGCVWGLFLCDWLYLTGASIPQLASAGASCLCYTKMLY